MELRTLLAPKICSSNLLLACPAQQQVLDPLDKDWSNPAMDRADPCKGRDCWLPLSPPGGSYFREKYWSDGLFLQSSWQQCVSTCLDVPWTLKNMCLLERGPVTQDPFNKHLADVCWNCSVRNLKNTEHQGEHQREKERRRMESSLSSIVLQSGGQEKTSLFGE